MRKLILSLLVLILFIFPGKPAFAQESNTAGPVYIVQSGDTLFAIAIKFGVTVDDLKNANTLVDPNFLTEGMEIVIPGLEGIRGTLVTETITLGETLRTLSIRHQNPSEQIMRLNRITSPMEVFAGASLIIPQQEDVAMPEGRYILEPGASLFQLAVASNANPWALAKTNLTSSTWDILPGEPVFSQDGDGPALSLISPFIQHFEVSPLPLVQGITTSIKVTTTQPLTLSGTLAESPLNFFPNGENQQVALQGIHAFADPGIHPIVIHGSLLDGRTFAFEQMVVLQAAGYARENINGVDPTTIDPTVTQPENDQVAELTAPATPTKHWDGLFVSPGYDPTWITSWYGTRRSYNAGPYSYFHTGVDYGGGPGLPIKAPAPGVVVFAGPLTVRGNATIIDHGWGVYSGFGTSLEILVKVGDRVETEQVIGLVGGTGRITGPHLHWEIVVNGVQVDPLTWLDQIYP